MAFLGLNVPSEIRSLFRTVPCNGNRVSKDSYHITLCYLGKDCPVDQVSDAVKALAPVMQQTRPFKLLAKRMISFPENPDDGVPIVCEIDSPDLHAFRQQICQALDAAGVEYSKKYPDYRPHVTLAYDTEAIDPQDIDPIEWVAAEAVLWAGNNDDERFVVKFELPLWPQYEADLSYLIRSARTLI